MALGGVRMIQHNAILSSGNRLPIFSASPNSKITETRSAPSFDSGFGQFALLPEVRQAIERFGIQVPTPAQHYAIPKLLTGENVLLISQTGRGKTLAYLIPIMNKLIESNTDKLYPIPNRPRAVIVVPTRELVAQALTVFRKAFGSTITSIGLAPGLLSYVKEKRILNTSGADVVITTPSRIHLHLKSTPTNLSHCKFLVVDEADTLCDTVYEEQVATLMKSVIRNKCQIAVVGATKTAAVTSFVSSIQGLNVVPTITEDAHTLVKDLEQTFVPVGRRKRTSCLTEILTGTESRKTVIFTNSVRTCNFVSRFLYESSEMHATSFHGEIPPKIRAANYKKFLNPKSDTRIMVCTNLASRGIDLDTIEHVIMYDFPHTLADYIHRAGRTARAGRLGKVTALYTKRNLPLAEKIQNAIKLGKPIEYKQAVVSMTKNRRIIKLEKYKESLDRLKSHPSKKNMSIRSIRSKMGLPPHIGIGSVERRAVAKEWRESESEKKQLAFLQKRKRLSKKESLPKLPDRGIESSETLTATSPKPSIVRHQYTGDLQLLPPKLPAKNFRRHS